VRRRGPAATARQLGKPITSLGRMRRDLPPELVTAIDLALDPRPERRPGPEELAEVLRAHSRELSDEGALEEDELYDGRRARVQLSLAARLFTGIASGVAVAVVMQLSDPDVMSVNPALAGVAAGLVVALLPRLGWIAAVAGLCAWLASPQVGQEGTAAVVAAACLPVPLLLRRSPAEWTLPGFAPLLAVPGLAPAYAAIAGQSATLARRAALGGLGWLWILLAGNQVPDPQASALTAATFTVFSALLPVLVRGLRPALDLIAAGVWAAALYAALLGIEKVPGPGVHVRGAAAGAALGAVIAVTAAAVRRSRRDASLGSDPVP
jgi:hypothetical protein